MILAAILILASLISIFGGRFVDRLGKKKLLVPMGLGYFLGMIVLFFLGKWLVNQATFNAILTVVFAVIMMGSYLVMMVILNAMGRDRIPVSHIGVFSGIRMIFFVMIPMIIGPFIGASVIKNSPSTYTDAFGVIQSTPTPEIFLAGSIVVLIAFLPIWLILRMEIEQGVSGI